MDSSLSLIQELEITHFFPSIELPNPANLA